MKFTDLLKVLKRPLALLFLLLVMFSASRILLVAVFWDRVAAAGSLQHVLLQGVRFDIILAGMLFGPVLLFKPLFHAFRITAAVGRWVWAVYLGTVAAFAFFVEASTLSFIREYDSRPNFVFVEYLKYPRELIATLAGAHLFELIVFTLFTAAIFVAVTRWVFRDPAAAIKVSWWRSLLAFPLIAIVVVMMIRSTTDRRPVNPSIAAFSTDGMVNQLPLNSPYSLLYAIYENRRDAADKNIGYQPMDESEVVSIVLADAGIAPPSLVPGPSPTEHLQTATRNPERPLNLVIILEESLGAEFVGSLGGKDLTPYIDAMATQGIWMDRLYATGTRSVRGIEAVITGITPTPRRSVVKLTETQENFFTLAELLLKQGYRTSFIYGGEAHFDNMRRFFLNNGFQTVIDQYDYENPVFTGPWGVSDEDLFTRADAWFKEQGDQPFFSLVFSSSNHEPFEIPAGRVEAERGDDGPRDTAVKYSDYALGQYMKEARNAPYWNNTVFLLIADHNSRVYGDQLVPIERFHIPGVILGGTVQPLRVSGITSQIDMLPTLLSLIGVSAEHPAIGKDLTRAENRSGAGRAMMQFYRNFAYIEPGGVLVLQPDLAPVQFSYQPGGSLEPTPRVDPALTGKALAYSWFGNLVIRNGWYHAELSATGEN